MRTLQVLTLTLCVLAGLYLITGQGFFMPDRWHPATGVLVSGPSARLLGSGLLVVAYTGLIALRHFGPGQRLPESPRWHRNYFLLLVLAIGLISTGLLLGERGPTPGWRDAGAPEHQNR
ncbi:MAG: hypothetical protein RBS40_02610 [Rhodocyclaceae bacterium]|jgi:hypothetical protein|nr:hypothetical protein [Rhodocyclaceae bacterium]